MKITTATLKKAIRLAGYSVEDFDLSTSNFRYKTDDFLRDENGHFNYEETELWNNRIDWIAEVALNLKPGCESHWIMAGWGGKLYSFGDAANQSARACRSNEMDHFGYVATL